MTSHGEQMLADLPMEATLTEYVTPVIEAHAMMLIDLVVRRRAGESLIEICVDDESLQGVSIDALADVSEDFSTTLEARGVSGELYSLEVSTPGIDRPLTLPHQWRRNRGRLVTIDRGDEDPISGRIGPFNDDNVTIVCALPTKKGQPINPKRVTVVTVPLETISQARLDIEFVEPSGVDWILATDDDALAAHCSEKRK